MVPLDDKVGLLSAIFEHFDLYARLETGIRMSLPVEVKLVL